MYKDMLGKGRSSLTGEFKMQPRSRSHYQALSLSLSLSLAKGGHSVRSTAHGTELADYYFLLVKLSEPNV
jgi:hypothetical protein